MSLTDKDLDKIKEIVKDTVEFAIEKSEIRMESKLASKKDLQETEDRIVTRINREVSDIAEMNRAFLAKLDNHETRIEKLETKIA